MSASFKMCSGHAHYLNSMHIPEKSFLNLHEVGAVISRSARTALRLIHDHDLKGHKLRGRWVVTPKDLELFLKNLPSNF